jgi:hypothetical protein
VDGEDESHRVAPFDRETADRPERPLERRAEALAAVQGDEDRRAAGLGIPVRHGREDPRDRVDDRVSDDVDGRGVDSLPEEILARPSGRREVERRRDGDAAPVELLRERGIDPSAPEPCLHVRDRDPGMERGPGRGQGGRRVALHDDERRGDLGERPLDPLQDAGRHGRGRLPVRHHLEVEVGLEAEGREGLPEHLPVLGRREDHGPEEARRAQRLDDGRELDRLRARADDEKDDGARVGHGPRL